MGIILVLASIALCGCQTQKTELKAASFNIHLAPTPDFNAWQVRKSSVAELVRYHDFDVFGTQEGFFHQIEDITKIDDVYAYVAHGRDDGNKKGETSAVIYKKAKYQLLDSGKFWFAEDTTKAAKGWDADCVRICSWAKLKDKNTGKIFYFFCLHFDHRGNVARQKSAELLLVKVKEIAKDNPFVIVGDFNLAPDTSPMQTILKSPMIVDTYSASEAKPYVCSLGTWHGYAGTPPKDSNNRIDYVLTSKGVKVKKYAVLTDRIVSNPNAKGKVWAVNEDGTKGITADKVKYPSDHYPVVADLEL